MKKVLISVLIFSLFIGFMFCGCSNSKITEEMVVGKWTPSTVEGDMEEVSCLYDNGKEIVSVELDNGGTGKLCYHEYFNTGNIFNDAINSQELYYYDCTWEIEGAYLKIKSEHNKTFAFSHTENGNWDLTSGEGGLIK